MSKFEAFMDTVLNTNPIFTPELRDALISFKLDPHKPEYMSMIELVGSIAHQFDYCHVSAGFSERVKQGIALMVEEVIQKTEAQGAALAHASGQPIQVFDNHLGKPYREVMLESLDQLHSDPRCRAYLSRQVGENQSTGICLAFEAMVFNLPGSGYSCSFIVGVSGVTYEGDDEIDRQEFRNTMTELLEAL